MIIVAVALAVLLLASGQLSAYESKNKDNDFPTFARAEYVYICMSTNGENEYVLRQCSCVIDEIAGSMTYNEYVMAETAVRMRQVQGEKAAQFSEVEIYKQAVTRLREAQAEAEIACF